MRPITVKNVWEYFGFRRICGNDDSLNRIVYEGSINRPGFELSGYFKQLSGRIVIIGDKETTYINTMMSPEKQMEVFDILTSDPVPMILISKDLPCPGLLKEIAERKNFPVFSSYANTSSLIVELMSYLEEYFAPVESLHGVLLQVFGHGVLLEGESGVGKSEIALELIRRGHVLIADDRVDVYRAHNQIYGEAPDILKGMLELRGVGIINIIDLYGFMSCRDSTTIECVIKLKKQEMNDEYDRIGLNNQLVETIFGIDLPKIEIPIKEGRSAAVAIEAAIGNLIMSSKGISSALKFQQKLHEFINKQKEEQK